MTIFFALSIAALLTGTSPSAVPQEQDQSPTFAASVDLVTLNVLVMDANGRPLKGLTREDFRVFEDDVEQEIEHFATVEAPFAVGLVLDTSYSTLGKMSGIQNAAARFTQSLHQQDEVMVVSFDDEVYLDCEFTTNRDTADRAIRGTRTGRSTQLYEAVYVSLEQIRENPYRSVMILFSDGIDTTSHETSSKDTIRFAEESEVLIYTIFFDTERDSLNLLRSGGPPTTQTPGSVGLPPSMPPTTSPFPIPSPQPMPGPRDRRWEREQEDNIKRQYMVARSYLRELAEAGGGVRFDSKGDTSDLGAAFDKIAADLRSIYTISYASSNRARDGKFREVTVKAGNGRRVRTRKGYYAPK